ncbi:hypothetical protein FQR65_LT12186 [Abscondita terminalis]|nr:hypothetical protein FQR65_LT12186 [Abscondita terminalis]
MFRKSYDYDVTVWSPQGRLYQVEYAKEAVKFGSAAIGLKSKTDAILVSLKRAHSDLAARPKKILEIDDNLGITYAGLTADVKILTAYMRNECLCYRYSQNTPMPARPYGVGIILAGCDSLNPQIIEGCPSGTFFNCKAMAIGSRCQSALTYLEKNLDKFPDCSLENLVKHGLRALQTTLPNDYFLSNMNVAIGAVGGEKPFYLFSDEEVYEHLQLVNVNEPERGEGK